MVNENNDLNLLKMLLGQLLNGNTIVERLDATSSLQRYAIDYMKDRSTIELICNTLKDSILSDAFYSVSANSATTLGSLYDDKREVINQAIYDTLRYFFSERYMQKDFFNLDPRIRKDLVNAIGVFKRESSIEILKEIFQKENSPFVKYETIVAIAKSTYNLDLQVKEKYIEELKDIAELPSFRYNNTRGVIAGLIEIAKSVPDEKKVIDRISSYIIEKSKSNNPYDVRSAAISQLGNLVRYEDGEINEKVFCQLVLLLNEPRFGLQQGACRSLVSKIAKPYLKQDANNKAKIFQPDNYVKETIEKLTWVAENDLDGWVRREAEVSLNKMKDWFTEWTDSKINLKVNQRK